MNNTSPKKPSPLSYGSPRTSPFKRPESPSSQSPSGSTIRATTPTTSPSKQPAASSFQQHHASPASSVNSAIFAPRGTSTAGGTPSARTPGRLGAGHGDVLSQLNPTQVHEIRESFQVLDRDDDGQVTRDDVAEILNQLGLDSSSRSLQPYFPPSESSSLNLATYLGTFATLLSPMSRPDDLTAAFAAFDVEDSGQIDLDELRDALLNTPSEKGERALNAKEIDSVVDGFTARRTFGKKTMAMPSGKSRGEVFCYLDFMGTLSGKPNASTLVQEETTKS